MVSGQAFIILSTSHSRVDKLLSSIVCIWSRAWSISRAVQMQPFHKPLKCEPLGGLKIHLILTWPLLAMNVRNARRNESVSKLCATSRWTAWIVIHVKITPYLFTRLWPWQTWREPKQSTPTEGERWLIRGNPIAWKIRHLLIIIIMVYLQYSNKREALTTVNAIYTIKNKTI